MAAYKSISISITVITVYGIEPLANVSTDRRAILSTLPVVLLGLEMIIATLHYTFLMLESQAAAGSSSVQSRASLTYLKPSPTSSRAAGNAPACHGSQSA